MKTEPGSKVILHLEVLVDTADINTSGYELGKVLCNGVEVSVDHWSYTNYPGEGMVFSINSYPPMDLAVALNKLQAMIGNRQGGS